MEEKEKYMKEALKEAKKAYKKLEIPVGAVIVKNGEIIARAYNVKEEKNDTTKHAEILAIQKASKKLKAWRLNDCEMYVTLEPCPMCAWAILQARLKAVYFGSFDTKYGALGSVIDLRNYSDLKPKVYGGIMEKECDEILKNFFARLR